MRKPESDKGTLDILTVPSFQSIYLYLFLTKLNLMYRVRLDYQYPYTYLFYILYILQKKSNHLKRWGGKLRVLQEIAGLPG